MYMVMNMLFQQQVIPRSKEPTPGGVGFEPRHYEDNFNHSVQAGAEAKAGQAVAKQRTEEKV